MSRKIKTQTEGKIMNEIVLIGPVAVGKTTTAKLIAERLNLPIATLDDLRLGYYKEIGYRNEHREELYEKLGQKAVYQYWKLFDAHSVERILEDHENCVFDFGGGSTACEFEPEYERIEKALNPYKNVVMLVPCADKQQSLEFIYQRRNINPKGWTLLKHFVFNDANYKLAKHIVYVKGKSPKQVCDEVLEITQNGGRAGNPEENRA